MKRTLTTTLMALLLCVLMVFGLTACGGYTQDDIDNAVNDATATLNEQITALEADIADKTTKIATLEGEKTALATEKDELEADIQEIEAEVTALETEKATLEAEVAALEEEKASLITDKATLEASITAKNNEIANLTSSISVLNTEKANLTARVTELEASITTKDEAIADLTSSVTTLQSEKANLESQITELQNKNDEIEKENAALKNCLVGNHASDVYTYTDNGDGTHTKKHECGVTVGEPENHTYDGNGECICGATIALVSTLDDLKAAIQKGGEYMLGDNIDVPAVLPIYTEFILHLNGKKLIGAVEGDVVLWGSSTSNVTILGDGVLTNSEDAIIEDAIINGTIIDGVIINLSGITNIAGGTFLGQVDANYGTCKISGGQIHYMQVSGATCTVNDGKIDLLLVSSTCTVNGGEIKTLRVQLSEGCVTITGGWVENLFVHENTGATCVITGGTFGIDPTAYVDAENYTVTNNGDGTWTVTAK